MNQPTPANSTNISSIHDSYDICAIEKISAMLVHSPVHSSPIFNYWNTSNPPSLPHYSSTESVTPKGIPTPHDNPPNPVPYVPADPDSDPGLSYSSMSNSYDSSDDEYYK